MMMMNLAVMRSEKGCVFRYGPRDITLVCTEIQKKLFVQYILCGIYYFIPVDCMDVICMVRIGKNIVM